MSDTPDEKRKKDADRSGSGLGSLDDAGSDIATAAVDAALRKGGKVDRAVEQAAASSLLPGVKKALVDVAEIGATAAATALGIKALEELGDIVGKTAGAAGDAAVKAALSGVSPGRVVGQVAATTAAQLATKAALQKVIHAIKPPPEGKADPAEKDPRKGGAKEPASKTEGATPLGSVDPSTILVGFRVATSEEPLPVVRMMGDEALSRPFSFDITVALPAAHAVHSRLRGLLLKEAQLVLSGSVAKRTIHGIVFAVDLEGIDGDHAFVRIRLASPLMKLALQRRQRIFQDRTTQQIVEAVLKENGITNADWGKLKEKYLPRNYCVQYRESDLDFVSRLLEEEGIFFFFDSGEGKEPKLIFADHWQVHNPIPGNATLPFSTDPRAPMHGEVVTELVLNHRLSPQKVTLRDFTYRNPQLDLCADARASGKDGAGELCDYPGEFVDQPSGLGDRLARVRMQELEVSRVMGTALSNGTRFAPGLTFVLGASLSGERHPCGELNQEYLVVQVHHRVAANGPHGTPTSHTYHCVLTVSPTSYSPPGAQSSTEKTRVFYRPPRVTPRPVVVGLHTATVVAPQGEEIHTDKDGRVRVHFPWHRGADSCWVRVSQSWAGAGFGAFFLPRAGEEVIVAFLEGDPDRPVIVGRLHNRTQPVAHELPAHKAWSYIRTQTTPGGTGYNEIRFQDEKEQELISMHAEKDLRVQVNHDEQIKVENVYQLVAGERIELMVGDSKIVITKESISINGKKIATVAQDDHVIHGGLVKINC